MLAQKLADFKRSKISILQLADLCPALSYEEFAHEVLQLEEQQLLMPVKASGMNGKEPALANTYKVNKMHVRQRLQQQVKQLKKTLHPAIWVEYYLTKSIEELEADLCVLQQLDAYLRQYDFPQTKVLAQERSFEIFRDEKWITEHGGKQFLDKVKVWDHLEIWPIADPVSFAINPAKLAEAQPKLLIVENKATFYSLLPALKDSPFTALLYGQGNAITGTIDVLPEQLPLNYDNVVFYYFGDIDAEGITIWYTLQQKCAVQLAQPFYTACLQNSAASGKQYQRKNEAAIEAFVQQLSKDDGEKVVAALQDGLYYPQEILQAEQLQQIWRDAHWM